MFRLLIIEDDQALLTGITLALKDDYHILTAKTLKSAQAIFDDSIQLVILDLNLPDGNGIDYLKMIKSHSKAKVIILTANDLEINIVTGLELGADDYITKPFSLAILRARIKTQLRQLDASSPLTYDNTFFHFDFENQIFQQTLDANCVRKMDLSKVEQKCLQALIANKGNTLTRERLLSKVWGDDGDFIAENALSVTIKRLRDKIEKEPSHPKWIKTVYGLGYKWEEDQ